jgi:hypothetical protein
MVHNLPFSALLSFCHLSVYLWNLGCYDSDVHGRMSHGCGQFSAHQRHQVVRLQLLLQGVQAAHYSCLAGCFGGCTWWGGCRPTRTDWSRLRPWSLSSMLPLPGSALATEPLLLLFLVLAVERSCAISAWTRDKAVLNLDAKAVAPSWGLFSLFRRSNRKLSMASCNSVSGKKAYSGYPRLEWPAANHLHGASPTLLSVQWLGRLLLEVSWATLVQLNAHALPLNQLQQELSSSGIFDNYQVCHRRQDLWMIQSPSTKCQRCCTCWPWWPNSPANSTGARMPWLGA